MSGNNIFFVVVKDVNTDHYCRVGSGNHTIRTIVHADPIRAPSLGIVQILAPSNRIGSPTLPIAIQ